MRRRSASAPLLKLFVYGTLKRGGRFHDRYCRGVLAIEEASVRGWLHTLPAGYPMLVVPKEHILADGTADAVADVATQARFAAILAPAGELSERISGEILTFDDPSDRLPALDELEEFHPGATSLYRRVLLAVRPEQAEHPIPAWTYVADHWPLDG